MADTQNEDDAVSSIKCTDSSKKLDNLLEDDDSEKMEQNILSPSFISAVKSKIVGLLWNRKDLSSSPSADIKPPAQIDESDESEHQLEQLHIENKKLKEHLQKERNQFEDLRQKYGQLVKEYNKLIGQQPINRNLLLELQMLFSETVEYHSGDARLKSILEQSVNGLTQVQSNNDLLQFIDKVYAWWKEYRLQLTVRIPFWRPDSWSRFEHAFPNNQITSKLILFEKYDRSH